MNHWPLFCLFSAWCVLSKECFLPKRFVCYFWRRD